MDLFDTVTLLGALVLALPIGMLGVEFLVGGRVLEGVGFLGVAAALLLGQHYLGTPSIKKRVAGTVLNRVSGDGDDDGEGEDGVGGDEEAYKR